MQVERERIELAKERLLKEFYDRYNRPLKTPKTVTQLETKLENEFFYWHVDRALAQMAQSHNVNRTDYNSKYA